MESHAAHGSPSPAQLSSRFLHHETDECVADGSQPGMPCTGTSRGCRGEPHRPFQRKDRGEPTGRGVKSIQTAPPGTGSFVQRADELVMSSAFASEIFVHVWRPVLI